MRFVQMAPVLLALALAACSSADRGTEGNGVAMVRLLKDQVAAGRGAAAPKANTALTVTRAQLDSISDPLIRARVENTGQFTFLYVAQNNGGSQIWFSPDKASVTMRAGLVTQTRGLGHDTYSIAAPQMLSLLEGKGTPSAATRTHRVMDGTNAIRSVQYDCKIVDLGRKPVVVVDRSYSATHYREECANESDRFVNEYWRDTSGVVRVSRQRISADFGYIFTERLID